MRNTIKAKITRNSDTYSSFLSRWSFDEAITTIPYFIAYAGRSLKFSKSRTSRKSACRIRHCNPVV
jgi:hypothetical protein